jgi:hypothetical protein
VTCGGGETFLRTALCIGTIGERDPGFSPGEIRLNRLSNPVGNEDSLQNLQRQTDSAPADSNARKTENEKVGQILPYDGSLSVSWDLMAAE